MKHAKRFKAPNSVCFFGALLLLAGVMIFAIIFPSKSARHDTTKYRVEVLAYADGDSNVSVEPFGYFMGEWNLWEFIGDSIAALIF